MEKSIELTHLAQRTEGDEIGFIVPDDTVSSAGAERRRLQTSHFDHSSGFQLNFYFFITTAHMVFSKMSNAREPEARRLKYK